MREAGERCFWIMLPHLPIVVLRLRPALIDTQRQSKSLHRHRVDCLFRISKSMASEKLYSYRVEGSTSCRA